MTDYFALMDEQRRPWLDPGPLKEKFLSCSSNLHPDRVHQSPDAERQEAQARYTEFNSAHQCLADPRARLLHLLELERGRKTAAVQEMSDHLAALFLETGTVLKEVDAFLKERESMASPLLRARHFARGMESTDRLQSLLTRLQARRESLFGELRPLNAAWEAAPPIGSPGRLEALPLERLEKLAQELSCLNRWASQLQERLVQLAL